MAWVSFWNREKILEIFAAAYSSNPRKDEIPKDTNAVEAVHHLNI